MRTVRATCALVTSLAVGFLGQAATADVVGVGLLQSVDIELIQGGRTVFHATNVNTTGMLGGAPIFLQTIGGTDVYLNVKADKHDVPGHEVEPDRWMQFTIKGRDSLGNAANLFAADDAGEIEVKVTNMQFDNVNAQTNVRVSPFNPNEYTWQNQPYLPFFYILDDYRGFVNLPGAERYAPDVGWPYDLGGWADPSVQVPMQFWADPQTGYSFAQVDNGYLTGFHLGGVPDFGDPSGPFELSPVRAPENWLPYFDPNIVPDAQSDYLGFASEISFNLNMRAYLIPEPSTLLLVLVPLVGHTVTRNRRRGR